jgi:hypothetical protein
VDDFHADQKQRQRPGDEDELEAEQRRLAAPLVRPTLVERVPAVDREPKGQENEEREREWRRREADDFTLPPKASETAQEASAEEEREAENEVADRTVERSGDERPDREHDRVVLRVVEEPAGDRRREHRGRAGKQDEQQHGLGPRRDVVRILLAKREEHRPRVDEHGRHPQPPGAIRRELFPPPCRIQERHGESVAIQLPAIEPSPHAE